MDKVCVCEKPNAISASERRPNLGGGVRCEA